MTNRKNFSIEEANALLPQLELILARLIKKKETVDRLHDEHFISELLHEATQGRPAAEGSGPLEAGARDVDASVSNLEADLEKIRALGCVLRHLDSGWVEFPASLRGEAVYFCWKKGEAAVGFYRLAHAAFAERLPL